MMRGQAPQIFFFLEPPLLLRSFVISSPSSHQCSTHGSLATVHFRTKSYTAHQWTKRLKYQIIRMRIKPVMLNEAKISRPRPRPRPGSWGRGRDRGQSFEVKAEAEANFLRSRPLRPRPKIKLWIKSSLSNVGWQHTGEFISLWSKRSTRLISHCLSNSNYLLSYSVMSCSRLTKVQTDWSVDLFLAAGSSAAERGQAEAKCLRPKPRPRPKFWPRGHFGLEALTSLH